MTNEKTTRGPQVEVITDAPPPELPPPPWIRSANVTEPRMVCSLEEANEVLPEDDPAMIYIRSWFDKAAPSVTILPLSNDEDAPTVGRMTWVWPGWVGKYEGEQGSYIEDGIKKPDGNWRMSATCRECGKTSEIPVNVYDCPRECPACVEAAKAEAWQNELVECHPPHCKRKRKRRSYLCEKCQQDFDTWRKGPYIIELEPGVFICDVEGDPGRTLVRENAQVFRGYSNGEKALIAAREYRPFENAEIILLEKEGGDDEG